MRQLGIWEITIGGGYGSFFYVGTEEQAEQMRTHKAQWEKATGKKRRHRDATSRELVVWNEKGPGELDCVVRDATGKKRKGTTA